MLTTKELLARIQPERLTSTTLELVGIPSPTGQTRQIAMKFAEIYRELGCDIHIIESFAGAPEGTDAPSVAAILKGSGDGPTLQMDGHSDTVPVEHTPAELIDGVIHGRGAADMKGGLASIMEVVRVLTESGIQLPGDLLLTTHGLHEAPEGHGEGVVALVDAGFKGDCAIVAEGPEEGLAIAGKGMAIFNITIEGPEESTHENYAAPGTPHPIRAAGELITALEAERSRLAEESRPYVGTETIFLGQCHSGDFYNRVPTKAFLQGTRRYFGGHDFDDVVAEFTAITDRVATQTGTHITVEFDRIRDGYERNEDEEIVQAYLKGHQTATGEPAELCSFKSVGDVSILSGYAGIPSIYCGYGGIGAHADHEMVSVDELVKQTKIILATTLAFYGIE